MKEAKFYASLDGKVRCSLCNHMCTIVQDRTGICGVRENREGRLYTLVYGKAFSYNVDPIEKKPLFHFLPGSYSFSFATVGCNFSCLHCQNWEISQFTKEERGSVPGTELSPEDIVGLAEDYRCESISYTYTEPTIFYEYAYDTAKIAQQEGIKNVFVTNGYIGEEALREISPYLDAANIDFKAYSEDFYRKVCRARLKPVLENIELYKELGVWIEVTTLIIPGYNDSEEELRGIAGFLYEVDEEIPWHVSRFRPEYKLMHASSTPLETLTRAREIGLEEGLKYVYTGNVPWEEGENTYCPSCNAKLVERTGFQSKLKNFEQGKCTSCGQAIAGLF